MSYRKFCLFDIEGPDGSCKDRTTAITGFIISEGRALFICSGVRYSQSRSRSYLHNHTHRCAHTVSVPLSLSLSKYNVDAETYAKGRAYRKTIKRFICTVTPCMRTGIHLVNENCASLPVERLRDGSVSIESTSREVRETVHFIKERHCASVAIQ